ncbi:hypothetical protein Tco_0505892 [Tanacetum coccineum]
MEDVCNISVWVKFHDIPITVFMEAGLSAVTTKLGKPLMLNSYTAAMCTYSWGRASYARAMVELRADVELKDTIFVVIPKFVGEGYNVLKNLKNPRQAVRGVHVGTKVGFNMTNQVYRLVYHNNCASTSGKKKQVRLSRKEVMLVDDDGKPLNKVDYALVNSDSDSDVEVAYDETAQFMASGGANDGSLYDDENYDIYGTYDIEVDDETLCSSRNSVPIRLTSLGFTS